MKKSLIALAALAATASFAQSSVTISGLLDLGVRNVNAPEAYADTKGVMGSGGSATTAILITGTEDLGGGMRATFRYEINPDLVGGTGFTGIGQSLAGNGAVFSGANTGANGYNFVGLESNTLGAFKIGRLNTGTLSAWGVASVFGTALGSGYGSAGQYARYGATATTFWNTAPTRFNNALEYQTPNLNGFTGRLLLVPQVNQSATADTTGLSSSLASASGVQTVATAANGDAVNAGVNRVGARDLSLAYSQGPLNVMVAQQKITVGDQGVSALVGVGPTATAGTTHTLNTLAANYTIGAARIQGGVWSEKQTTNPAVDLTGFIIGGRYVMGATTLMASSAQTNDKSANNRDRRIVGVGAEYALSKRSALWARYEKRDANKNNAADDNTNGVTTTTAVGVRHTF